MKISVRSVLERLALGPAASDDDSASSSELAMPPNAAPVGPNRAVKYPAPLIRSVSLVVWKVRPPASTTMRLVLAAMVVK